MGKYLRHPDTYSHIDRYVSQDSCKIHGIGIGVCRICLKSSQTGDMQAHAKHIAGYDAHGYHVAHGFPRMFSL
jgi:hypothetical protein